MKCHYDVLNIARDASLEEIKKAYKKLAIKWHPDKNLDNTEAATEQFQLIQQAFEVLSDSHERAWYDNHRDAILKGKVGGEYEDDSLDVYQYFTASCYKGFGDDRNGFYSVYREVFNKIAAEDSEYYVEGDSDYEIPSFGRSDSSYEEVKLFYAHWQSYCTKKSYSWLDPYDSRTAENRRISRLIEKENKKVRDKAKKAHNEEVRELVSFVRKRDKRMQAYALQLQKLNADKAIKTEEKRREKIMEQKKELISHTESEWSKFSNLESELKNIEAKLASEFGESISDGSSDTNIDDQLYCIACNKLFKTSKAFENHESSKKHKENVLVLKQNMLEGSGTEYETDGGSIAEDEVLCEYEGTIMDDDQSDADPLFCEACAKQFKTSKAIDEHKTTTKHLNNFKIYKEAMRGILEDDDDYEPSNKLFDGIDPNSEPRIVLKTFLKDDEASNKRYDAEEAAQRILNQIDKFTQDNDSIKENVEKMCNELDEILNSPVSEDSDQVDDILSDTLVSSQSKPLKSELKNIPSAFPYTFLDSDDDYNDFSTELRKKQKKKKKLRSEPKSLPIKKKHNKLISVTKIDADPMNTNENETSSVSQDSVLDDSSAASSKEKLISSNKTSSKKKNRTDNNAVDINVTCAVCKETFPSKTKLFVHLSKTGHSVHLGDKDKLLSKVQEEGSKSINKQSKSRKGGKCK